MVRPYRKIDMTCVILLGWSIVFISRHVVGQTNVKTYPDPSCTAACSCCLGTSPCTSGNDGCSNQCIDGIFGGKCKNKCPTNCKRCTDHPDVSSTDQTLWNVGYCTDCKDGYYSTSQYYQCQVECSTGCQICNSITDCTSCLDGYFKEGTECSRCKTGCDSCTSNNDCTQCTGGYYNSGGTINNLNCVSCSDGCNNQCDSTFGTCTCKAGFTGNKCDTCVDGRYGGDCSQHCVTHCRACTTRFNCTSCVDGYYWDGNNCQPCQTGCSQCSSSSDCTLCKDEYYSSGNECIDCSSGCSNMCDKVSGTCSCNPQYTGDKCDTCIDGWYGPSCNAICSQPCKACTSSTDCTSCVDGYYWDGNNCQSCQTGCAQCSSSSVCTLCKNWYYSSGTECVGCSSGCSNMCDKVSGTCSCRPQYTGDKCDTCIDGWYGPSCNAICSQPCKACTSSTDCESCVDGYVLQGTTCSQCKPGCAQCSTYDNCIRCRDRYYSSGTECVACSNGCRNQCNDGTGTCICKPGFDGGTCDRCLPNFEGTDCNRCINNYHGLSCDETCPSNCKNNECTRYAATCNQGCIEHFTGSKCTDCAANYAGETCDECIVGKHGTDCRSFCSSKCKDTKCGRDTGACDSCHSGKYGDQCNITCSSTCLRSTCAQKTGACVGGCNSGYSGDMCCLKGSSCKTCSSASQCSECLPGKYGETCADECPTNCADGICDKKNGTCNRCKEGFQGESCDNALATGGGEGGIPVPAIVGGVTGAIAGIVLVVVLIIVFIRRRASDKNRDMSNGTATALSDERVYENESAIRSGTKNQKGKESAIRNDKIASSKRKEMWLPPPVKPSREQPLEGSLVPDVQAEDETLPENDYYNSGDVAQKGIPINELAAYIDQRDSAFFESEFTKLPQGLIKPTEEAKKEHNLGKNRYNAIYPCFRKRREYIASLGPIAKATEGYQTFWRMVWQEKTEKIVMVTNLMENGGMKCEKYWPDVNKFKQYGDVTVACHSQDAYAEYTVRSFTVKKGKEKQRSLHHIHYTAWPDKGVPDDVTSLIEFRNKVNSTKAPLGGPVIVHCSAGVGRTGTYIALDILTYKGEKTGYVDIFDCVEKLRQQRTIMVQTAGQYEYVHRALAHTLSLTSEAIPADKFQNYASSIPETMFDKLSHCKEKVSNEDKEAFVTNKALTHLNRKGADIPGDSNRPRLYMGRTTEDNNYINAVYVNSFKVKNKFIMTQTPLPTTVNDFLTLVVQENCSCIVSMDPPGLSDKSIGTYLPADNQELSVEPFKLKTIKVISEGSFTQRTLTITSTLMGSTTNRTVQHFQYTRWPGGSNAPAASGEFLQLVKEVQKASDEAPTSSAVIVHCRTGSERSGLLCVVVSLLQKMEIEHEVSVINTVRQVKFRRPKAIPNKEQFTFCHTCVASYLKTFDIYSNFS